MTNDNSKYDDLMDELASIRPKQSESNPIPERVAQQREESRQRAMEEKEKDYYANKKPTGTGVHRKRSMGLIKCGSVVIPFDNQISKDTDLYKLYNTNLHEKNEMMKAKELSEKSH